MKTTYPIFILLCCLFSQASVAQTPVNKKKIEWRSVEEVEELMKTAPRKVYVDIYTDWCGWCKVMDNKTFSNTKVIEYINTNYYAIHLNAERADTITFRGKKYGRLPNSKTNELAADWMKNRLSYPTSIFFEENFSSPQPIPGYLEVPMMEMILKYLGENHHKNTPWEKFRSEFKGTW